MDGQQRITTLALLCCALVGMLSKYGKVEVMALRQDTKDWLKEEIRYQMDALYTCTTGQQTKYLKPYPFPRLVRHDDTRGFDNKESEYRSVIAQFLRKFRDYYENIVENPGESFKSERAKENNVQMQLNENYDFIYEQVERFLYNGENNDDKSDSDIDVSLVQKSDFNQKPMRRLCNKFNFQDEKQENKAIADIAANDECEGLIRVLLFCSYFMNYVVLTRVNTENEKYAFDIFDALNTTGEPLTALETFKPQIIRFESNIDGYEGSETEFHFNRIKENLNDIYPETEKRQKATKELLVTFALYLEGYKLPLDLASQRNYLRTKFGKVENRDPKRRLVQSLADIAEFRQTFWNRDSIHSLNMNCPNVSERLKLCCKFILDMNTSLAIPVLARYWIQYRQDDDVVAFANAVQAVTAFLVLRRSITGTTGKIDADFRKIMKGESQSENSGLCVGLDHSNSLLSLDKLKETLRGYLAAPTIGVKNKETWISQACEVGLAEYSRPLCRFLLFAASDNARPDTKKPDLLTREGITKSDELDFFNYGKWEDNKYATVEHVAPNSDSRSRWDKKIYLRTTTRHMIGNIILLPKKENSSVGNAPWTKKKIFYSALIAKTEEERNEQFERAKNEGLDFKNETKNLLKKQGRLHMLDPIANVTDWTESLIQRRTKNTLELAWDIISPWLDY